MPDTTQRHEVATVACAIEDGSLIELVYDSETRTTALAVGSGAAVSLLSSVDMPDGRRLVPWNPDSNLIKHGAVLLPERPEAFTDVPDLLESVDQYLCRYIDLDIDLRRIVASYILLTWVYDRFNELPYLRFRGDLGSGKTRALIIAGGLCYRAFFASGASTVSPIFHTLDTFRGTLVLDEADFRFSDEKAELSKILNNGNVRGFPVLRTMLNARKEFDPRAFNVFGPKLIAMRGHFDDAALESRFITIEMEARRGAPRAPINLPDIQRAEASMLRNKLLAYRFACRHHVAVDPSLYDDSLSPRANQVTLPLLSLVDDPVLRVATRRILRQAQRDNLADRAASPAGQLMQLLADMLQTDDRQTIALSDLAERFIERFGSDFDRPITNRYIGSLLRRVLDIHPYKSHGTYQVPLDRERIALRAPLYGVEVS
jgi:hypothetical protein